MDTSKKEQLKRTFKTILTNLLKDTQDILLDDTNLIDIYTNELLKEVSIRTPLK